MTNRCCSNCFTDKTLKLKINTNGEIARCHYCGNNESSAIPIDALSPLISSLIDSLQNSYEEANDGMSLINILSEDLKLFSKNTNFKKLIDDAICDKGLLSKKFKNLSQDTYNEWEIFKTEIKHNNRFFPQTPIYKDAFLEKGVLFQHFTEVIEQLNYQITPSDIFYRARTSETPLQHNEMGKPPIDRASIGRANPDGISYLYVANNLETSLTEVRPSNGQTVFVAQFKVKNDLNVINLMEPRRDISFVSLSDNDNFTNILKLVNLLEEFSKELSLPVLPNRSRLDYIPTQFITEFFKNLGNIDGIIFNSSFGKGYNLVFFDDSKIECSIDVELSKINIHGVKLTFHNATS